MAGRYESLGTSWPGSLAEMSVRMLAKSGDGQEKLINQFLNISDLNEWGSGIALQEFAQSPTLVKRLRSMLEAHRPGFIVRRLRCHKGGATQYRRNRHEHSFCISERRIQTTLRHSGRVLGHS